MGELYIYPEVKSDIALVKKGGEYIEDTYIVVLETFIRKKHRKKYYLQRCWNKYYIPDQKNVADAVVNCVNRFHANVYRVIVLGTVDTKAAYPDYFNPAGRKMFVIDSDQRSEEERLKV